MTLLGFTFGVLELTIIGVFLLAMIISVAFDRRGEPAYKWVGAVAGIGGILFFTKDQWTLQSLFSFLLSAVFWVPVLKYLGAGFLYAIVEFIRDVRVTKRLISEKWEAHLARDVGNLTNFQNTFFTGTVRELYAKVAALKAGTVEDPYEEHLIKLAKNARERFVERAVVYDSIVKINLNDTGEIQATVDKGAVATNVGPWVLLWPFYFMSLIVGDLLAEVFATFASYLSTIGGRYIRSVFQDVFKF